MPPKNILEELKGKKVVVFQGRSIKPGTKGDIVDITSTAFAKKVTTNVIIMDEDGFLCTTNIKNVAFA